MRVSSRRRHHRLLAVAGITKDRDPLHVRLLQRLEIIAAPSKRPKLVVAMCQNQIRRILAPRSRWRVVIAVVTRIASRDIPTRKNRQQPSSRIRANQNPAPSAPGTDARPESPHSDVHDPRRQASTGRTTASAASAILGLLCHPHVPAPGAVESTPTRISEKDPEFRHAAPPNPAPS